MPPRCTHEQCWEALREVDVLPCSTASPVLVVTVGARVSDADRRSGRYAFSILDIALPRMWMPRVGELDNVFLYDLDDLRIHAAANSERREEDIPAAQQIIAAEAQKFWDWVAGLAAVLVVRGVREEMEKVRRAELAVIPKRLGPPSAE